MKFVDYGSWGNLATGESSTSLDGFNISLSNAIVISMLVSIVELFSNHKFNDNISIPIICAFLLSVIK